jgi:purine-binding chemotaxis protein CheW
MHVHVRVGRERYAFCVSHVREVAELDDVTPVPGAGAAVIGVRNLRGRVLPVVDLARVIDVPRRAGPARMVVVEGRAGEAGIAVDEIVGVGALPPPTITVDSPVLDGAAVVDGTLVAAVGVDALLEEVVAR